MSIHLYALPYAGGHSLVYRPLQQALAHSPITLQTLELPGRGKRAKEPLLHDIDRLVEDLFSQLRPQLTPGQPYALFGHSMGSLLAVLLARHLAQTPATPQPCHLFCSGRGAPQFGANSYETRATIVPNIPSPRPNFGPISTLSAAFRQS